MPKQSDNYRPNTRRIVGPGAEPPNIAAQTKYALIDGAYFALLKAARYLGIAVTAGAATFGVGSFAKNQMSDVFNSLSSQTSVQSVALPPPAPPAPVVPERLTAQRHALLPLEQKTAPRSPAPAEKSFLDSLTPPPLTETIKKPMETISDLFSIRGGGPWQRSWSKNEILAKIRDHTDNDPISFPVMKKIIGVESHFDPLICSSKSSACGLGQHIEQTQLEYMFKNKSLLPHYAARLADGIEPNQKRPGYRVKQGHDRHAILKCIEDPDVSIILTREHVRERLLLADQIYRSRLAAEIRYLERQRKPQDAERIQEMKRHLARPLTVADADWAHMMGHGDAASLMLAYADPKNRNHKVTDYANPVSVQNNRDMFYNGSYMLTLGESRARVIEKVGNDPLPRDLSRPQERKIARHASLPPVSPS